MAVVTPMKPSKSLSATPPRRQENGMTRLKESKESSSSTTVSGIVLTPPLLSTSADHDLKSDSDPTMISDTPPNPSTPVSNAKKQPPFHPQLISHLPCAHTEALSVFTEISDNQYQYGTLGRSREALESMTCDCLFDPSQSPLLLITYTSLRSHSFLVLFSIR